MANANFIVSGEKMDELRVRSISLHRVKVRVTRR